MPRRRTAASYLGEPPSDPNDLAAFPAYELPAGATLHRVHRKGRGAWFFSTDPDSRFTPLALPGEGTCYFALQPVAALLEALRGYRFGVIAEDDILTRRLFTVTLDRGLRLGDLTHPHAARWGVNGEVHATTDYGKTQRWAGRLLEAGFDGVRYLCRSDPGLELVGVALFDAAGEAPDGRWPDGIDAEIGDALMDEASTYGMLVLPTP